MTIYKNRRQTLKLLASGITFPLIAPKLAFGDTQKIIKQAIPVSGEKIPVIGMGTWQTFNVGSDPVLRKERTKVLKTFFDYGGRVIDCSPMYGSSADVLGYALEQIEIPENLFAADKVWTSSDESAFSETSEQKQRWGIREMDLMQVHNLLNWQDHLPRLQQIKADGHIRYVGITTSHARRHEELADIMKNQSIDFVQLTYNITHREVEKYLLPIARDKGIAVIANRPYDGGYLIKSLKRNHPVPEWAAIECDCKTWADFLLKFIVSHPAITCAIPATSKIKHMQENMEAAYGLLPNARQRQKMIRDIEKLI